MIFTVVTQDGQCHEFDTFTAMATFCQINDYVTVYQQGFCYHENGNLELSDQDITYVIDDMGFKNLKIKSKFM